MEDKLDSFEEELSWCVEQLELGLESQNPNSKQGTSLVLSSSFDSYAFHSEVGKGGGGRYFIVTTPDRTLLHSSLKL